MKAKEIKSVSLLFFLFTLLLFQDSTSLERKNQVKSNQVRFQNEKSFQNPILDPDFGKTPLYFIPNEGQVDEKVLFYAKSLRYTLWLTKEGIIFDNVRRTKNGKTNHKRFCLENINNPKRVKYDRDVSRLIFFNANKNSDVKTEYELGYSVNYIKGHDKSKWRTDIATSKSILYKELYRNIDLKVYGVENQIEYDFIIRPGGEVSDISFEYKDIKKTRLDEGGNLVVETKFGKLMHARPVCYQVIEDNRLEIGAEFKEVKKNTYSFNIEEYNSAYTLIIDPLVYSTYLGGAGDDHGSGIAVDKLGAAYVVGYTNSANFPTKNPIFGTFAGGDYDIFVTKMNPQGDSLEYSTYMGGSGDDYGLGIAVDKKGAAYVTGGTESTNFPTKNPMFGVFAGGNYDAFVTKINSKGDVLIYSTYLGGSLFDYGNAIAVDKKGAAYVTGWTSSTDFPKKKPIYGNPLGDDDGFIIKIKPRGDAFEYSTYLGGSDDDYGNAIAVDKKGAAYVTGTTKSTDFPLKKPIQRELSRWRDIFVTKINPNGTALLYSTYLGGSDDDGGTGIAVDKKGAAYVTGLTLSTDFPTMKPIYSTFAGGYDDAFVTKIKSKGNVLEYSTYLGGSDVDCGLGIAVDKKGSAYVTGWTSSTDFPLKNPIQTEMSIEAIFITKIHSNGKALLYSTYLGGSGSFDVRYPGDWGNGIAVDKKGAAYVTGYTGSTDFPTKNPFQMKDAGRGDAFITKIK